MGRGGELAPEPRHLSRGEERPACRADYNGPFRSFTPTTLRPASAASRLTLVFCVQVLILHSQLQTLRHPH